MRRASRVSYRPCAIFARCASWPVAGTAAFPTMRPSCDRLQSAGASARCAPSCSIRRDMSTVISSTIRSRTPFCRCRSADSHTNCRYADCFPCRGESYRDRSERPLDPRDGAFAIVRLAIAVWRIVNIRVSNTVVDHAGLPYSVGKNLAWA